VFFLFVSAFLATLFLRPYEPRPVPLLRQSCRPFEPPASADFSRTKHYASARYRDKSGTLSRTWRPYIELLVLRQFDLALPLVFGRSKSRSDKSETRGEDCPCSRVRSQILAPNVWGSRRSIKIELQNDCGREEWGRLTLLQIWSSKYFCC